MTTFHLRLRNSGLALLAILALLLLFLLARLWPGSHPLATKTQVDLCGPARVAAEAMAIGELSLQSDGPGRSSTGDVHCVLTLRSSRGKLAQVSVGLLTQAMLRRQHPQANTSKWLDLSVAEANASGGKLQPLQGPWKRAALGVAAKGSTYLMLFAEDDGVALTVATEHLAEDELHRFLTELTKLLRRSP